MPELHCLYYQGQILSHRQVKRDHANNEGGIVQMIRHLLIIVGIFAASMSWLIWLCRTVDPSTRYGSEVEYNYARYCAGCHGANGEGNGRIGRFKKLEPANLTATEFWGGPYRRTTYP